MTDKKLFLLDAYALIYRAYYALIRAPRLTSQGFNTSAIFGFVNTLEEVLNKENPTHIAVCFDPEGPTFRHEAYEAYKAQRDKQPEDITRSIPIIKDIIKAYGIPVIEVPGYEADDVIGTLSHRAEAEGYLTYMMTPDKDYGQLVSDRVLIYKPSLRGSDHEIRGPKEVCERYGIKSPRQVIDILALEGDAVDNIPGCPGVGEKTAIKLIDQWQSVENLLDNAASIKGAIGRRIVENAEGIRFSKFLATIKTDVPVDISVDSLARGNVDTGALLPIFTELEFKTFIKRLHSHAGIDLAAATHRQPAADAAMPSLFDEPASEPVTELADMAAGVHNYVRVTTVAEAAAAVDSAIAARHAGIALYAVGADAMTARWMGIALSSAQGSACYIDLPPMGPDRAEVLAEIARLMTHDGVTLVSHDVKRDCIVARREGIELAAPYFDTSVAHYLLEPEMNHSLARVAAAFLGYRTIEYDDTDRPTRSKKPVVLADSEVTDRMCEAADITLRLYHRLDADITAAGLQPLMHDIELPLVKVLADMEWTGVRIDPEVLAELSRKFTRRLHDMEQEAYRLAGTQFNIGSPMQVGEVLFDRLKIDPNAKRTKRGAYSTTEEILEKYREVHPLVSLILDIRGLRKLLATYVDALPQLVNPATGKIHTTYNQTVTATGRISSTNPNLQNIPIRTDDGREIRRAFIADRGDLMLSADYSQIELRLIASISGDRDMIDAFLSGADIHQATASKIYKEPLESVTPEQRRRAKTANFGIIYGISAFGLSERLHIPRPEAKMLIDGYFATYPHIREYMDESIERARADGYVSTIMGRKRMLPDINSRNAVVRGYAERNAINAPIQGSAADIIKLAMVRIAADFAAEGLKSRMIMQVHDELIFNVVPHELPRVQAIVERDMAGAYQGSVPLVVSAGVGTNWLEAH